jgi:transcriptional regulator with XRE-family HTH domain
MWKFDFDRIRILRESKGMGHETFSRNIESTGQQVKQWEAGNITPTVHAIVKLCNVYNVVPGYFFEYNGGQWVDK